MTKKEMFVCDFCKEAFEEEISAASCEEWHKRERLANSLLLEGKTLYDIQSACRFSWNLRDDLKLVTKDNCFIVSFWQCCEKPAYQIDSINGDGYPHLWGCGSWSGYYGGCIQMNNLPKPHPKEELFIDARY